MLNSVKNYNGVTIVESTVRTLKEFARKFGTPKIASCKNSTTGEEFKSLAFVKDGNITWCHFGYSTQGMSAKDIAREADNLKVGRNTSGKYTLFKQSEDAWDTINIDF
jgi:hypothetical protein